MIIVVWTKQQPFTDKFKDYWAAHESMEAAELHYKSLVADNSTYSASICSVIRSADYDREL